MIEKMQDYTHDDEIAAVKSIFEKSGFDAVSNVPLRGVQQMMDVDVLAIFCNAIVIVECVGKAKLGEKLKESVAEYGLATSRFQKVVGELQTNYQTFYQKHRAVLDSSGILFRKLLVSSRRETRGSIGEDQLLLCDSNRISLWTREEMCYFMRVSDCTYEHCRYEILDSLGVKPGELKEEEGESPTLAYLGFGREVDRDLRIVNFAVKVSTLLRRSTIRRLRDSSSARGYQRLLDKNKLRKMRGYLLEGVPAYPNNIICVLHGGATLTRPDKDMEVEFLGSLAAESPYFTNQMRDNLFIIKLPVVYDAFEIVDGQHRLFSFAQTKYHTFETFRDDSERSRAEEGDIKIQELARTSYMVVTAIHSSPGGASEKWADPRKLFLEVNTTQTKISPEDLIDLVERIYPSDPVSQANRLLTVLNGESGVLKDKIKVKFWQEKRIKRTSLIKFSGLKDVFDSTKHSYGIFSAAHQKQKKILSYPDFCCILMNNYLCSFMTLVKRADPELFKKMEADLVMEKYCLYSAVMVGALIRLLRHFLSEDDKEFCISEKIDSLLAGNGGDKDLLARNLSNPQLQKLFEAGLRRITETYGFTREEFDRRGWGPNRWAQIESDLFYTIRGRRRKFGSIGLIAQKYRHPHRS
jgi:DGQHR domain-containing protein